jgi:hypothetical protein
VILEVSETVAAVFPEVVVLEVKVLEEAAV